MSNVTNYLSPEEINAYQSRTDYTNTTAMRGLGRLDYQRGIADQDFARGQTKMAYQWDKQFKGLGGGYAKRGLLRSGAYQRRLGDYAYDRGQAQDDYRLGNQRQNEGFNNQQQDIELMQGMSLSQVDRERQARQATLASQLRSV